MMSDYTRSKRDAEDVPEGKSLATSALQGIAWNWVGSGVLVIAQVASTAATARLVAPREFGLYAAAQATSGVAGYFAMRAVAQDLQRRSALGPKTVGTAMTIMLTASGLLALCLWFGAPLWARAWGVPGAAWPVRVFGVVLLLQSVATVPLALIRRHLRFRIAAVIETGAIVIGLIAGVALAVQLHSALALALGQAVGVVALLIATSIAVEDGLRPAFDRADGRELFAFAGQVGGLGLLSYAANTIPSWFAARAFGASVLGLYSRANLMVGLPATYAVGSIHKIIYPLYGRVRDDPARVKVLLEEALALTTGLAWPVFAFAAGSAPITVRVLLGARWVDAAPFLALCALTVCATIPVGLLTNCAEALGWMRIIAARQIAFVAGVTGTAAVVYFGDLSMTALLVGVAVAQWLVYSLTISPFVRKTLLDWRSILRDQGAHAGAALVLYAIAVLYVAMAGEVSVPLQLTGLIVLALVLGGIFILCWSWLPVGQALYRRLTQVAPGWWGLRLFRALAFAR